jgi:hypothetical protein
MLRDAGVARRAKDLWRAPAPKQSAHDRVLASSTTDNQHALRRKAHWVRLYAT